jgi:hypothetical protein
VWSSTTLNLEISRQAGTLRTFGPCLGGEGGRWSGVSGRHNAVFHSESILGDGVGYLLRRESLSASLHLHMHFGILKLSAIALKHSGDPK